MSLTHITARDALARLWLPWCVERERPERPIRIEREPEGCDEARQLRVSDLDEEAVRAALLAYLRDDGRDVLTAIQQFATDFAQHDGRQVISDAEGFEMPEGLMLHEASHRACAIYESGIADFEIRVTVHPIFEPWKVYDHPSLRRPKAE